MSGEESKDETDRCLVYDAIFKWGPASPLELETATKQLGRQLNRRRIAALTDHDWFQEQFGVIYIANMDGCRRATINVGMAPSAY